MAEPVHAALVREGHRVRVYAPVGELLPGIAYLVRRLLENTSNESFVRHRFAEGQELDALIRAPAVDEHALGVEPPPPVRLATDPGAPVPFTNEPRRGARGGPRRVPGSREPSVTPATSPLSSRPSSSTGRSSRPTASSTSVDPGSFDRVVCRSGCADPAIADRARRRRRGRVAGVARDPVARTRGDPLPSGGDDASRRVELAALEVFEAGKPVVEADADVCEAIDFCEYYGREALRLAGGSRIGQVPGETNTYSYEPLGIGVVISPWNFPLAIPTGMVTAALVTGNAVLFKPAEQTPGVALRLVEILHEAGVPPGVLAFLPGVGEEVGATLVEHPAVAFVAFTGSKAVGLQIIERAAVLRPGQRQVKRVLAEMGGKNPVVVDADADLDVAVPAISHSAFGYAGQKCSAASRVIALDPVFDELVERVAGGGADRSGRTGPRVAHGLWTAHRHRRARTRAAIPVAGARRGRGHRRARGRSRRRVVSRAHGRVTDNPRARIVTDEIFGPVLAMLRATDFDHALALANDTDYALTAGLFSRSPSRIAHASRSLRAGDVYVNRGITGARVGRQPFGGSGLSGVGSKRAAPTTCCSSSNPASSPRTPSGRVSHHHRPNPCERDHARCRVRCSIVASAPG